MQTLVHLQLPAKQRYSVTAAHFILTQQISASFIYTEKSVDQHCHPSSTLSKRWCSDNLVWSKPSVRRWRELGHEKKKNMTTSEIFILFFGGRGRYQTTPLQLSTPIFITVIGTRGKKHRNATNGVRMKDISNWVSKTTYRSNRLRSLRLQCCHVQLIFLQNICF